MIISYPEPDFRTKEGGGRKLIFDALRKKWVTLTPEEWVRQNFIQYLVKIKNYPASLIAVEKEILLGELKKRFDILVHDPAHLPWMMIECKAAGVKPDNAVLDQALRYNISIPVKYIVITNGHYTHAWQKTGQGLKSITALPPWPADQASDLNLS